MSVELRHGSRGLERISLSRRSDYDLDDLGVPAFIGCHTLREEVFSADNSGNRTLNSLPLGLLLSFKKYFKSFTMPWTIAKDFSGALSVLSVVQWL